MSGWTIFWIVIAILAVLLVGLYFWGSKLQKKYEGQQQLINENKQAATIFVIDKRKDVIDNLKLPKQMKEQLPKLYRKRKLPVVIAKIGSQIQTLMCDESVYNTIPVKKQIKVELAGILIVNVLSGKIADTTKKGFMAKTREKLAKQMKTNK